MSTLLVVDDDPLISKSIELALAGEGINVATSTGAADAIRQFTERRPDCVLCDVRLPESSGLELLAALRGIDPKVPVILMTGYGTAETAIDAMRRGAFDYLLKPFDPEILLDLVQKAFDVARLMRMPARVAEANEASQTPEDLFIGQSPAMQEVFKTIGRVAPTDAAVLILGESGTGKELAARAIYHYGRRAEKPFLAINCAAIPESLLESELFGHEKGSFTGAERKRIGKFEQCHGGTLFLDEIGDMTAMTQAKILRVLQDGTFQRVGGNEAVRSDVRILAATSRNLDRMIAEGGFREDLFYRLNTCTIRLPALRDRHEDIEPLVRYFLRLAVREFDRTFTDIAPEALAALKAFHWPGNVRQLQSVVKQALLRVHGPVLTADALPAELTGKPEGRASASPAGISDLDRFIREQLAGETTTLHGDVIDLVERQLFTAVLESTRGNLTKSATILGITRPTLRSRLQHLGIELDRFCQVNVRKPS